MSYFASDIGTVPAEGFKWYVIFVEGAFADVDNAVGEQINKYFLPFGKEAGPEVLAVQGYDPVAFRKSLMETGSLTGQLFPPAVVVTDTAPAELVRPNGSNQARVMIFPLKEIYEKRKDISNFLRQLLLALQSSDANAALKKLDQTKIEKYWSWITDYVEMKPKFLGVTADLGKLVSDMLAKAR